MGILKALGVYSKLAVQIRARFPDRPCVRRVSVERKNVTVYDSFDGPGRQVAETVISYEYKVPYPYPGQAPWQPSTLVIHERGGKTQLLDHYNHMGLQFDPPNFGSGSIPIWLISLPLSALAPVWLTWHLGQVVAEHLTEMTRHSRAAFRALEPHLDEYNRLLLADALRNHWEEYRARTA